MHRRTWSSVPEAAPAARGCLDFIGPWQQHGGGAHGLPERRSEHVLVGSCGAGQEGHGEQALEPSSNRIGSMTYQVLSWWMLKLTDFARRRSNVGRVLVPNNPRG